MAAASSGALTEAQNVTFRPTFDDAKYRATELVGSATSGRKEETEVFNAPVEKRTLLEPPSHEEASFDVGAPTIVKPDKHVDAVVSAIDKTSAYIDCLVAGDSIEIVLPLVLVPQSLRNFGQPISLSLAEEMGIRTILVEGRSVVPAPDTKEMLEIDAWLSEM